MPSRVEADPLLAALLTLIQHFCAEPMEDETEEPSTNGVSSRVDRLETALLDAMKRSRSRTFGSNY